MSLEGRSEDNLMPRSKSHQGPCVQCGSEEPRFGKRYCSQACYGRSRYEASVALWKQGKLKVVSAYGELYSTVRTYLHEKYGNSCQQCGWGRKNPITGKVPLQINHIDGDWKNTTEENLELLCPNCHALTPNFGILNIGQGRPKRGHRLTGD